MDSLIDTNVVSEYRRSNANSAVVAFLRDQPPGSAYLSVVTLSEIRFGIERSSEGERRRSLERWLTVELPRLFAESILPITNEVGQAAGVVRASAMKAGRPMGIMDSFLAATAEVHGLTLVTRNVPDFEVWGGPILNPWTSD